jgi:hypothetical protein
MSGRQIADSLVLALAGWTIFGLGAYTTVSEIFSFLAILVVAPVLTVLAVGVAVRDLGAGSKRWQAVLALVLGVLFWGYIGSRRLWW